MTSTSEPDTPPPGLDHPLVHDFLRRCHGARPILFLDYDGTLAPFVPNPDNAVPYPGVRDRLRRIVDRTPTRLIIVSGRAVASVDRLLDLDAPVEIWGNHGLQRRRPHDSRAHLASLPPLVSQAIEQARAATASMTDARVEHKPASVAVHVRGLSPDTSKAILKEARRRWRPLTKRVTGVELHPFDGGLEFRSSTIDKGSAVREVIDARESEGPVAYLGDDLTDEDAFDAIGDEGLKVLVRPESRPSAADIWIRPPEELLELLDRWLEHSGAGSPAHHGGDS